MDGMGNGINYQTQLVSRISRVVSWILSGQISPRQKRTDIFEPPKWSVYTKGNGSHYFREILKFGQNPFCFFRGTVKLIVTHFEGDQTSKLADNFEGISRKC